VVLIVDDDPRMSSALVDEVSSLGLEASSAFSADSAVEKLLNAQVEVMVTDLRMGGRDGESS
jgi:DNA-binding NtrC family response regulator